MQRLWYFFCPLLCFLILSGCDRDIKPVHTKDTDSSKTVAAPVRQPVEQFPLVHYTRTVIHNRAQLDSLRKCFANTDSNQLHYRALTTVNRKDIQYFRVGDTLMMPDTIAKDLRIYSAFPSFYPAAASIPKIIMISNKMQCYACYDSGKLVRFAAANTGEEHKPTFPGRYALNWRDRLRRSSLDSDWVLPFTWNFHLQAGSAFHQFDMPGRPVSHSCVRQFYADAQWLFSWGQGAKRDSNHHFIPFTGTPVIIMDLFNFARKKGGPWWDITTNRDSLLVLPDNPMNIEEALIPISQIPKDVRGSLRNRQRYVTAEDTLRARGVIRQQVSLRESIDYNKQRRLKALQKAKAEAAKKAKELEHTEQ